MTVLSSDMTLGALAAHRPELTAFFDAQGLDYCCGGAQPLSQACAQKGLDAQAIWAQIREWPAAPLLSADTPALGASLSLWADHIVETHHAYLNRTLPQLSALLDKTRRAHGERHGELIDLQRTFEALRADLEAHLAKEETVLFPYCKALDTAQTLPAFHCGSIENPIRVMREEHDLAGDFLRQMRALSDDYTPPADACATYRAAFALLAELERDLHTHIHKENNILFPRAAERAQSLASGA
ncbi:MAG: iron-sulfur cluster repair di-iron protein [Vampirovibrionales bacterium]|nr:iron-sulfur cluster repair di-iron protein [Vampirovibrionales bacterium]